MVRTAIVAVGLLAGCGAKDVQAPARDDGSATVRADPATAPRIPDAAPKPVRTCIPTGVAVEPGHMALTGSDLHFCFVTRDRDQSCFTANLATKTIVPVAPPTVVSVDDKQQNRFYGKSRASIEPSASGKGVTVCSADKMKCHEVPIDAAYLDKPTAVSDDATLVAIDTRTYRETDTLETPGKLATWDAVTGKKLASFDFHYGQGATEYARGGSDGAAVLAFFDRTVIAFMADCALPCSTATMYSARGKYLGMLAAEASSATAVRVYDDLYILHAVNGPFVAQHSTTGQSVQLDSDTNWDAIVTPDRIVRVVGPWRGDPPPRGSRVEVWGPDLKRVTEIAIPTCPAAP